MSPIIIPIAITLAVVTYVYIAGRVYVACCASRPPQASCDRMTDALMSLFWLPVILGRAIRFVLAATFRLGAGEPKVKLPRAKVQK